MQQNNIAIKVKGLSKDFDISESGKGFSGKLRALLHRKRKIITAVDYNTPHKLDKKKTFLRCTCHLE